QSAQEVVARDYTDAQLAAEAQAVRDGGHRLRARLRIHAAGVRGDLDVPFGEDREEALHQRNEILRVSERRVSGLLLLQDRHRDFGEVVHHQVIDGPARHLAIRGLEPVAPKPLSSSDPYCLLAARPGGGGGGTGGGHLGNATRRTASGTAPPPLCTRRSTSGPKPSGSGRSAGRL